MNNTFLGLPVLQQRYPSTGAFLNIGAIIVFTLIPMLLILWLVFNQFQNADKPTTITAYTVSALVGVIVQHVLRVLANRHVPSFYSHWSNAVVMYLGLIIGYIVAAELI